MSDCIIGERIGNEGYARVPSGKRGRYLLAHRVAWEQRHGRIPSEMHVHHECGTRSCVNVEHMTLVTPREHPVRHRKCDHGEEHRHQKPGGGSYCRICVRVRRREYERKRYRTDPEFRARRIARVVAYKQRKRASG